LPLFCRLEVLLSPRLVRLICALATITLAAIAPALSGAAPIRVVALSTGHSMIVKIDGISRIAVGDDKIAGVVPIGTSQMVINGKQPGRTTVDVWARKARFSYDVTVVDQSVDSLAAMLRTTLAEPMVDVVDFGHSIVARGTVDDMASFERVTDLLARFDPLAKKEGFALVDAVTVKLPFGDLQRALTDIPNTTGLRLDADAKGNIIVSGQVVDRKTAENVLDRVRGVAGPYLSVDGKVVDRLAVATVSQIDVKVYVLEIDQNGLSQLGIRLQGANPDPNNPNNLIFGDPTFHFAEGPAGSAVGKALTIAPFFRETLLAPTLDLIMQTGHARILSEPNLVTLPGQKANFLVGGQIPYAYSTGLGQTSIVFKDYGVQLEVTPTLLGSGSIETKIAPEVSQLDFQDGITLNGYVVPAFKTSRLSTDIVTQPGESIVMGGLLQHVEQRNITKIPLLGDLPILGNLFRSTRYQSSQTDVVFVMTPTIITR
jgi:pilus assembly protein CpaC